MSLHTAFPNDLLEIADALYAQKKNLPLVVMLYQSAVSKGHSEAACSLAAMYYEGNGVPQDLKEACRLYGMAAEKGHVGAQFNLALVHSKLGNLKEAIRLYYLAAEAGSPEAYYNLALIYDFGEEGIPKDPIEAARLYREAASKGNAGAQFNLGVMYFTGDVVERNYEEAARLYRLAADQGHAKALYYLGLQHQQGLGVEKNTEEAIVLFRAAAEKGFLKAERLVEAIKRINHEAPIFSQDENVWLSLVMSDDPEKLAEDINKCYKLFRDEKLLDEDAKDRLFQQTKYASKLVKATGLLRTMNAAFYVENLVAITDNAAHADILAEALVTLAKENPKLYQENRAFLIQDPENSLYRAKRYLRMNPMLPKLPPAEVCSNEILRAIGKEILTNCKKAGGKISSDHLNKFNGSLLQQIGAQFLHFANNNYNLDDFAALAKQVAKELYDLFMINISIQLEKTNQALFHRESPLEVSDDYEFEETIDNSFTGALERARKLFVDVFINIFNQSFLIKWSDIFLMIAKALNAINIGKKELLYIPTFAGPMADDVFLQFFNAVSLELNNFYQKETMEKKPEEFKQSMDRLSKFIAINQENSGIYYKSLHKIKDIPFSKMEIYQLSALNLIVTSMEKDQFSEEKSRDKNACMLAIAHQIKQKDPKKEFSITKIFDKYRNSKTSASDMSKMGPRR